MKTYGTLLLLLGWYGIASSQSYVPSDGAMAPALVSGTTYAVVAPDSLRRSRIAVFTHNGVPVARRVMGTPEDKVWPVDPDFRKQAAIKWGFFSVLDDLAAFFSSPDTDIPEGAYLWHHFASSLDDTVFTVILSEWEAAPVIGDSLFYMDADAAGFDDSAEWGYIHQRDITGIILPSEEEE